MPPKRRAAVHHRLVRQGGKAAKKQASDTPSGSTNATGELDANYATPHSANPNVLVDSSLLVPPLSGAPGPSATNNPSLSAAAQNHSTGALSHHLQAILQLINNPTLSNTGTSSQQGPSNVPAISNQNTSSSVIQVDSQRNTSDVTSSLIGPSGNPLSYAADNISAHVKLPLKEKVWNGEYIDLALLVEKQMDNEEEEGFRMVTDSTGKIMFTPARAPQSRKSLGIGAWTSAFHVYMSIYLEKHASFSTMQGMLSYMETLRNAAITYGGDGWLMYDKQFRCRIARDPTRQWGRIDGELWLRYMLPQPNKVKAVGAHVTGSQMTGKLFPSNICWDFNKGACMRSACRYPHKCGKCGGLTHGATNCFRQDGVNRPQTVASQFKRPQGQKHNGNSTNTGKI